MKKNLLLTLIVTLVCLLLGEAAVRVWFERPGFRDFPEDQPPGLYVPHPTRSYALAPNYDGKINAELYTIRVSTNNLGLRDGPVQPGETIDVLAVGGSFTDGFGVEAEEAWPSQLETALNSKRKARRPLRVLNGAVSSYGLAQIRTSIKELLYLKPKMVVIGLYMGGYRRLDTPYVLHKGYVVYQDSVSHFDVIEDGFVYTQYENRTMQRLHLWSMKHYQTGAMALEVLRRLEKRLGERKEYENECGPDMSTEELLHTFLEELERTRLLCEGANTPLVVMLVNKQSRDGSFRRIESEYNSVVKAFCRRVGITVFDPLPTFVQNANGPVFRIGTNSHWSRRAHSTAGLHLAAFLMKQDGVRKLLDDEAPTPESVP